MVTLCYKLHVKERLLSKQKCFLNAGNNDVAPKGKQRLFLSFPHCRAALDLKRDKNYLIMGASRDIHMDRQDNL